MDVTGTATLEPTRTRAPVLPQDARASQGVWLLLASLSVFFVSSILLYVVYVAMRVNSVEGKTQTFTLPLSFIPSTLLLIVVSCCLEVAYRAARRDRLKTVQRNVIAACVAGIAFLFVQSDGMYRLIYGLLNAPSPNLSAYGYTFILAVLHALHVVGGVIGLWWTTRNAIYNCYDHERSFGLKFCALYWHFLDIVWLFLIASFLIAGVIVNARVDSKPAREQGTSAPAILSD